MPYITTAISDNSNYTLVAQCAVGSVAVTVLSIKSSGSISAESLVNPNGSRSVGNGVSRIVFISTAETGTTGVFEIVQSGQTLAQYTFGGTSPLDLTVTAEIT